MSNSAWHITMRLSDDTIIAPSPTARRTVSRCFLRKGEPAGLLAFATADTHLHALVVCSRVQAGRFARIVEITLQANLPLSSGFAPAYFKSIANQRHLQNAFWYVLRQQEHHGIASDPRHDGSCLADLLGLRMGGGFLRRNVGEHLPRVPHEQFEHQFRVPQGNWKVALPIRLKEAALAAVTGDPSSKRDLRLANLGAVHAAGSLLSREQMARMLAISPRSVDRLRSKPVHPFHVEAVRRQLAIRTPSLVQEEHTHLPNAA
jgi:hypothetical protein